MTQAAIIPSRIDPNPQLQAEVQSANLLGRAGGATSRTESSSQDGSKGHVSATFRLDPFHGDISHATNMMETTAWNDNMEWLSMILGDMT